LLFMALLLPGCIFVFLKIFGRNEFGVEVLFEMEQPEPAAGCAPVKLPYRVDHDLVKAVLPASDSLTLLYFETDSTSRASATELRQLKEDLAKDAIAFETIRVKDERFKDWYWCRFLMRKPFNTAVVDQRGAIRGQYNLDDRDEADRLRTEITILLKKY
jgi:hypothetical protein